jgi:hypothetical protein
MLIMRLLIFYSHYNKGVIIATALVSPVDEMWVLLANFDRKSLLASVALAVTLCLPALWGPADAAPKFVSCGGAAMLGGAQLNCSHLDPKKPSQLCNFSWTLLLPNNVSQVVSGSFLLPQGANNTIVYQGSGFTGSLTMPVILCQDQRRG